MALSVHFGESGGHPWALSARSRLQEGGAQFQSLHFNQFRRPKGVQKAPKIELKSLKHRFKKSIEVLVGFLIAFWGVVGQLSTLRGTPPQHPFVVDLLWNDPAKFEFCF